MLEGQAMLEAMLEAIGHPEASASQGSRRDTTPRSLTMESKHAACQDVVADGSAAAPAPCESAR